MSIATSDNGHTTGQPRDRQILAHHRDELYRSGLIDATIRAAGIYSVVDADELADILNRERMSASRVPALVFPFPDEDGRTEYARAKPDHPRTQNGRTVKYESPTGRPNEPYIPTGTFSSIHDPAVPLLITEGEKKSLAADQAGLPCLGLVGVFGWKQPRSEGLNPAMARIAWRGRDVFIVFDCDRGSNPDVRNAESRLALQLQRQGASVRIVRLPPGAPAADGAVQKVGLDDYLVASGVEALHTLIGAAVDPEPLTADELRAPAGQADPRDEVCRYLERDRTDGLPRILNWSDLWWRWENGRYVELTTGEVQADLVRYANQHLKMLQSRDIANFLLQLAAQATIPSSSEPPGWLGEPVMPWRPRDILVAKNGLIHLPTLVAGGRDYLLPPTPRFFSLSATDFDFNVTAPQPALWLSLMNDYWREDGEAVRLLQEWFGLSLVADTSFQKILLLIGPTRSGKGLIARVQRRLVGPLNVGGPTLANLATNFGLSQLLGKSLGIISDARLSGKTDQAIIVERLLAISGEDCLTVDRKHLSAVTLTFPTRLMVLSNELPRLHDASGALAGRMLVQRMTESFYGREDRHLFTKLVDEMPGILLWSIAGWHRLMARGCFEQAASGNELAGEMRDIASPVSVFLREKCNVGPEFTIARKLLHAAYVVWCKDKGRGHVEDDAGFGRALLAALPSIGNTQPVVAGERVRHYTGIGLK